MRNILVSAQLLLYAAFCPGFAEALTRSISMLANVMSVSINNVVQEMKERSNHEPAFPF